MSYGEGVSCGCATGFSIYRPNIELPLDELLGDEYDGEDDLMADAPIEQPDDTKEDGNEEDPTSNQLTPHPTRTRTGKVGQHASRHKLSGVPLPVIVRSHTQCNCDWRGPQITTHDTFSRYCRGQGGNTMVVSTSIGCSYNVPGESISLSDTTLSEELSEERLIASTDGSDEEGVSRSVEDISVHLELKQNALVEEVEVRDWGFPAPLPSEASYTASVRSPPSARAIEKLSKPLCDLKKDTHWSDAIFNFQRKTLNKLPSFSPKQSEQREVLAILVAPHVVCTVLPDRVSLNQITDCVTGMVMIVPMPDHTSQFVH
ncbi:uncharacterized protein EDB93DRAFT_1103791 [Suillus bovinus]|uniref:uncharacterized protein n=1 Tax=Suillus bovinus TaxID=48563 RepID=UPI001B880572|nr:uncharacterized protein EDB93DRAFT_1103791 [Suillus bovinus]KAG2148748.1 hypothetical protein EDB93DRAFT_1103791 [Suillus bovinus]